MKIDQRCLVVLAFSATLAGCGSLGDLRNQPADRVVVVTGTYDAMAKCVANEADSITSTAGSPSLRFNDAERTATVFNLIQPSMTPQYEIAFIQQGKEKVRVEGRGMSTIYGTDFHLKHLWPSVDRCSTKIQRVSGRH